MSHYIIGIDPDSQAHGVAIYINGKIDTLKSMPLMQIFDLAQQWLSRDHTIEFHIENVCADNKTYKKQFVKNRQASTNVTRSLGMCQQSQIELERALSLLDVTIVHHPISKNWKDAKLGKKILEQQIGWTGKSNEDTRSAAYFGFLGVTAWKRKSH